MIQEPAPRQIDSWLVAEENAAEWMRYWGHLDAACTSGGADGGVDVRSGTSLAQVKFEAVQVGSPTVQRLVGARGMDHHLALFFFSGAGYARPAIDYADVMGVALFKYDLTGRPTAVNHAAADVVHASSVRSMNSGRTHQTADGVSAAPQKEGGTHGWWRRNWSLVLGLFFVVQTLITGGGVIQGNGPKNIDWYDPIISLVVGTSLLYLWARRRRSQGESDLDPMPDPPFWSVLTTPGVTEALTAGNKIQAIKMYRQANPGLGLRRCKDIIDTVAADPRCAGIN